MRIVKTLPSLRHRHPLQAPSACVARFWMQSGDSSRQPGQSARRASPPLPSPPDLAGCLATNRPITRLGPNPVWDSGRPLRPEGQRGLVSGGFNWLCTRVL